MTAVLELTYSALAETDTLDFHPAVAPVAVINGTHRAEILRGTGQADELWGFGGDDILLAGKGADFISGGAGDDWLYGGSGRDELHGGSGNDHFVMDDDGGRDVAYGNVGNDRFYTNGGGDKINSGNTDDIPGPLGDRDLVLITADAAGTVGWYRAGFTEDHLRTIDPREARIFDIRFAEADDGDWYIAGLRVETGAVTVHVIGYDYDSGLAWGRQPTAAEAIAALADHGFLV